MTQTSLPNYADLEQALEKTALTMHAAEVHGLMSGILAGDLKGTTAWEGLVLEPSDDKSVRAALQALQKVTKQQLEDFLFDFELFIPADEEPLPARAKALSLWCQGFLLGLKSANVKVEGREPSELTEAIKDLVEIAKMDYEVVVASEEDEVAYTELVEYVRMAVIYIYQELKPASKHLH